MQYCFVLVNINRLTTKNRKTIDEDMNVVKMCIILASQGISMANIWMQLPVIYDLSIHPSTTYWVVNFYSLLLESVYTVFYAYTYTVPWACTCMCVSLCTCLHENIALRDDNKTVFRTEPSSVLGELRRGPQTNVKVLYRAAVCSGAVRSTQFQRIWELKHMADCPSTIVWDLVKVGETLPHPTAGLLNLPKVRPCDTVAHTVGTRMIELFWLLLHNCNLLLLWIIM